MVLFVSPLIARLTEGDRQKIRFTEQSIAKLKPRTDRYLVRNANLSGHYIRVYPTGSKAHYALTRDPRGKQVWHPIGDVKPEEAEELARDALKAIKRGQDRSGPLTVDVVAEQWFKRHVEAKGLRSAAHIRLYLNRHILPAWAGREFTTIRRGDVTALLDAVEDSSGPVAADKTLALVSNICNWFATRHDDYSSPIIKGMRRSNPKERARTGENPDDIRMRWMAMADKMQFDVEDVPVYFIEGTLSIRNLFDRVALGAAAIGEIALVIVDTSAAFFEGDDENNNVQMQEHALLLRQLTTLPGKPCVVVACHPTKSASNDRLLPRGGGAFVAAIDGNLVAMKRDSVADLHWQEKFRGPDFEPIGFQLLTVTSESLKDQKDRLIPTVIAKPLTEQVRNDLQQVLRRDEDDLLSLMNLRPGGTHASMAEALGWMSAKGEPQRYRVSRAMKRLEIFKYVQLERDGHVLTQKGKEAARRVA